MANLPRVVREGVNDAKTSQPQAFRGPNTPQTFPTRLKQLGSLELAWLQPWMNWVLRGGMHQNQCITMPRMMTIINKGWYCVDVPLQGEICCGGGARHTDFASHFGDTSGHYDTIVHHLYHEDTTICIPIHRIHPYIDQRE